MKKRPAQIDRHDAVPHRRIDFGALGFAQRREQRGIVHEDVDLAKARHCLRHQRLYRCLVADVGDRARNRIGAVLARERLGDLLAVGNVGDHEPRALGGERSRVMHTDALGAAGDDGDAPVQSAHCFPPLRVIQRVVQYLPPKRSMNLAKASSCCLMKPTVC